MCIRYPGPRTETRSSLVASSPDSDEVAIHSRRTISGSEASTAWEAEGVVPYTLESGWDDGSSRWRGAPEVLPGRRGQTPPPSRTERRHGTGEEGEAKLQTSAREGLSPMSRRGGCAKPLSLAATVGREGRATSPLLLRATPPRHHGRPGEAQRSRTSARQEDRWRHQLIESSVGR
jgi:hypothetical protein